MNTISDNFAIVTEHLPDLSNDELEQVIARAKWLTNNQSTRLIEIPDDIDYFYEGISKQLRNRYGINITPLHVLLNTDSKVTKNLIEAAKKNEAFVKRHFKQQPAYVREKIYMMLAMSALNEIDNRGYGTSLPTCLSLMKEPAELFESAFPGYIENGIPEFIIKAIMGDKQ